MAGYGIKNLVWIKTINKSGRFLETFWSFQKSEDSTQKSENISRNNIDGPDNLKISPE
jgi:hypothetical protein